MCKDGHPTTLGMKIGGNPEQNFLDILEKVNKKNFFGSAST